ncbi:50S ribosome-binding GTPase [Candidatus Woesearchaeota archaeon]|nr:50S ribosome-binding GTPase [Candidatus Woesearchaeota archaeon]
MANYWDIVNKVIRQSDVLLFVLDTRQPDETRNPEIERKIRTLGKRLLYVLNKCDLVSKERLAETTARLTPSVYVSCTKFYGATKLREAILRYGTPIAKHFGRKQIYIGVIGYPNVGKSSVINLLKGKGAAPTSPQAGFTRGYQFIRISDRILLVDTPGVLARGRNDEIFAAKIGAKNPSALKDPDLAAIELIEELEGVIEKYYHAEPGKDAEETLHRIAKKQNYLKRGGEPDIDRMARRIIQDWQHGKIKRE